MAWFPASRRTLAVALAAVGLIALSPASASAARYTTSGTVVSTDDDKKTLVLLTSDIIGKDQPITIDMSDLPGLFRSTKVNSPLSLTIQSRDGDTYLATGLVSEGSYVDRETFGTREEFETLDSSIKAHVGNVPEDDESLSKQHRDNKLRDKKEEDNNTNK